MRWWAAAGVVLALLGGTPARADSWAPATRQTYEAAGRSVRFTVIPREIRGPLAYFTDKEAGKEPAGQKRGSAPRARGVLARRQGGRWVTVWDGPLLNDVAPVSALVANDGGHVVTFDDWHSTGLGAHVVVIYRSDGSVVRSFALPDILPEDYVRALPRSVSSLWWSGERARSAGGRTLVLKVVVPDADRMAHQPGGFVDVAIDLATGNVAPLTGPAWERVQAAAPIAEEEQGRASNRSPAKGLARTGDCAGGREG